jgi:ABC-type transport system substrate-binding protein
MFRALVALSLVVVASLAAPRSASAEERVVYAGVFLHDVARLELRDGMVDVDFELWAKWRGELEPSELQIANAADLERELLSEERDGDWHAARWRVRGTLRGEFPLQRFPFDAQVVAIVLELPEARGKLVPDAAGSGMAERLSLTDWLHEPELRPRTERRTVASDLGLLEREGLPSTVNRVSYEVRLVRPILTVALKLFLPLAIIALVAFVAFFLPADALDARASIGVTALLSCFAFQYTIAESLPSVAYLTLADLLFLLAYVVSAAALVETIGVHALARRRRHETSARVDLASRVLFPVLTALGVWLAVPSAEPVHAEVREPLPSSERHASTRDVLRIGTNRLTNVLGSPIADATFWSLLHEAPGERPQPWLVERRPGVDNDAVRFLADGALAVRWRLREGLRWSDDRPVVADDLRLPWEALELPDVRAFEVPDDRTLVVTWSGRVASALDAPDVWPSHVLRASFAEGGYEALREKRRQEPTPSLGPYRVIEHVAGERVVVESNPRFVGEPPAIRRVEVRVFPQEALVDAFLAGEVDLTVPNAVTLEQALAVRAAHPERAHVRPSDTFVFLAPDLAHPLLGRRDVRRAILAAVDSEALARELYGDAGRVAHVAVPLARLPEGTETVAFDPETARRALAEAGASGARLELIRTSSPMDLALAASLRRSLEAVGLVIAEREVPSTHALYLEGGHGGLLAHVLRGELDAPPRRYWNLPLRQGVFARDVRHDAYDDEVDALVVREEHALFPERRDQLRERLLAEGSRRLPLLPLVFAAERVLADPKLRGWDRGPGVSFGAAMERWWFEE